MLRRRCGMRWLRRWRRTGSWRRLAAELREENARLREENARLRARDAEQAAELEDCGLTWRFCSGWCSGGRRSGRARSRLAVTMTLAAAGIEAGIAAAAQGVKRGPGARAGRRDYSHLPRFEVFWDFPGGGYCCPECGEPFTLLGDHLSGEQLDWQVIVRVVAHCRRRYRRACALPGAGDGDGARPAEGDREGPVLQRVHRDAAHRAVRRRAEHELAGDGPGPAGRGGLAGDAGRDVRAGRGAAGPARGGDHGAVAGLVAPARGRDHVAGLRAARRRAARRSGGCGCSSARTPCAS